MNYKETNLTGTAWTRCRAVTINNPLQSSLVDAGSPVAYFQEEQVISMEGANLMRDSGACSANFASDGVISLRDLVTGDLTGATTTHAELYQVLYSLYMQTALERDAVTP